MKTIKIIKILSEYEVIINSGLHDGVEKGDVFNILDPDPRVIEDYDTGELLDSFKGFKDYVIVNKIKDKYSVCNSHHVYKPSSTERAMSNLQGVLSASLYNTPGVSSQVPLNVSEYEIDNIFSEYTKSIITVGDTVEKKLNWH